MKIKFLIFAVVAWLCSHAPAAEKPNIVLIVADDLGYGDTGCYGATKIKTPNIDRLAGEGIRLTDAHASAAVCQPSRYAILSGTYFLRAKRQSELSLFFHEGQVTLPALLKSAGYRTAAIGKWHLGFGRGTDPDYNAELKPGPLEIGFDEFFGTPRTHNEPPFVFVENHRVVDSDPSDPIRIVSHDEVVKRGLQDWGWGISEGGAKAHAARPTERIDPILADKAAQFITRKSAEPFFLYLAFLAPHVPIAPSPEFQGTSQAGSYGDFIQQLDTCVGKVLASLQAGGLADNTLVIFTSDNGAVLHGDALAAGHHANGLLLGQKTDAWDGGHRVPFIARWPGRIPPGSQSNHLFGLTDLMATIAAAADIPLPAGAAPDSLNELPVLMDPVHAPVIRNEMLMQGTGGYVLRQGDWVYLPKQGSCGMTVQLPPVTLWGQPYAKMGLSNSDVDAQGKIKPDAPADQLYHLGSDPWQGKNVTRVESERAKAMRARLEELTHPQPAVSPAAKKTAAGTKPNVIIILADDLGYGSLGCYGNTVLKTPNVDRLAAQGIRFTDAYAPTSVCTPSRYALLTGEYAWRGPTGAEVVGNAGQIIAPDRITLPRIFQGAGYVTAGFGKWNLGLGPGGNRGATDFSKPLEPGPRTLGFDYFFGIPVMPAYPPSVYFENEQLWNADPGDPLKETVKAGPSQRPVYDGAKAARFHLEKVTTELTDRICTFIEKNKDKPFFLYYPMTDPHEPFTPNPRFYHDGPWGKYGACIEEMDWSVGAIVEALEKVGIADNTLLIFTSDNGGIDPQSGDFKGLQIDPNAPLRGCKGGLYEGGLRIPFILRWPGVAPAGMVSSQPLQMNDFLATFAALLGRPLERDSGPDSFNLLPAFYGEAGLFPDRALIFQGRGGACAIRQGDWKYIDTGGNGDFSTAGAPIGKIASGNCQLFNLALDLGEKENLADQKSERSGEMKALLEKARKASTRSLSVSQ